MEFRDRRHIRLSRNIQDSVKLLEKFIKSCRFYNQKQFAGGVANVLILMNDSRWNMYCLTRFCDDLFVVQNEEKLTFKDHKRLVVRNVGMKRRPTLRGRDSHHHAVLPTSVCSRHRYGNLIAKNVKHWSASLVGLQHKWL